MLGLRCCMQAFFSCGAQASHYGGLPWCRAQAPGAQASVVVACGLSSCGSWAPKRMLSSSGGTQGLAALQHVGSSRTRARTRIPCIGWRIPTHCATREVPIHLLLIKQQMASAILIMSPRALNRSDYFIYTS